VLVIYGILRFGLFTYYMSTVMGKHGTLILNVPN
jgi:hypothetical protein